MHQCGISQAVHARLPEQNSTDPVQDLAERARFGLRSSLVHGSRRPTSALRDSASAADLISSESLVSRSDGVTSTSSLPWGRLILDSRHASQDQQISVVGKNVERSRSWGICRKATPIWRRQTTSRASYGGLAAFDEWGHYGATWGMRACNMTLHVIPKASSPMPPQRGQQECCHGDEVGQRRRRGQQRLGARR